MKEIQAHVHKYKHLLKCVYSMRCILSSKYLDQLKRAGSILDHAKIKYKIDQATITDLTSNQYNDVLFSLWIIEETDIENAKILLKEDSPPEQLSPKKTLRPPKRFTKPIVTLYMLFTCIALFLLDTGTFSLAPTTPYSSATAFYPIRQWLLFDYPSAVVLEDSLIKKKAISSLTSLDQSKIQALHNSSFWGGFSFYLFARITHLPLTPHPTIDPHLLFEKIREGQVWRLFTPVLLHGSLLHLLFNMTWFYILGRQIEERIKGSKYFLFMLVSGIITNLSQYIISGYAFLGFSGILLAMAAFIITRMSLFPHEGFYLEKALYKFFKIIVIISLLFSLFLFGIECYMKRILFSTGFANTAHVTGLLSGIFLGRLAFFSRQKGQNHPQN